MASDGLGRADADATADAARNTFWKGKISHQSSVNNCITLQLCPKEMGKRGNFGTERLRWQLCVSRETAADLHDPVGSRDARRWTSKARARFSEACFTESVTILRRVAGHSCLQSRNLCSVERMLQLHMRHSTVRFAKMCGCRWRRELAFSPALAIHAHHPHAQ